MGQADGLAIGALPKTLDAPLFTDGDVIDHDGYQFLVRIFPATPHETWGPQARIYVSVLDIDTAPEADVTDDEAPSIHDCVTNLICTLALELDRQRDERHLRERDQMNADYYRTRI